MNEINHLLNLHPDSTATDERTDNESESFSCSLNESKSEAGILVVFFPCRFPLFQGKNSKDTIKFSCIATK